MQSRVLGAGVLGALVMVLASFVVNGIFGFTARLELRPVPNEAAVSRSSPTCRGTASARTRGARRWRWGPSISACGPSPAP